MKHRVSMKIDVAVLIGCNEAESLIVIERPNFAVVRHNMGLDLVSFASRERFELPPCGIKGVTDRDVHLLMLVRVVRFVINHEVPSGDL